MSYGSETAEFYSQLLIEFVEFMDRSTYSFCNYCVDSVVMFIV